MTESEKPLTKKVYQTSSKPGTNKAGNILQRPMSTSNPSKKTARVETVAESTNLCLALLLCCVD